MEVLLPSKTVLDGTVVGQARQLGPWSSARQLVSARAAAAAAREDKIMKSGKKQNREDGGSAHAFLKCCQASGRKLFVFTVKIELLTEANGEVFMPV